MQLGHFILRSAQDEKRPLARKPSNMGESSAKCGSQTSVLSGRWFETKNALITTRNVGLVWGRRSVFPAFLSRPLNIGENQEKELLCLCCLQTGFEIHTAKTYIHHSSLFFAESEAKAAFKSVENEGRIPINCGRLDAA